ncbi:C-type lectin domain protein [Candidatus Omnitrophus magneticus]|uniref:C-type lectin domain protein n=1 Tax=Candidatus Omnitrophus magneticus TaxID=1609969 RepID=A0A0F0CQD6_9BACT|nr:C-type lectin domain protein [Candidatus Omnitrophus magneticus]
MKIKITKIARCAEGWRVDMRQLKKKFKTISERLTSLVETGINSGITKTAAGCRKGVCTMCHLRNFLKIIFGKVASPMGMARMVSSQSQSVQSTGRRGKMKIRKRISMLLGFIKSACLFIGPPLFRIIQTLTSLIAAIPAQRGIQTNPVIPAQRGIEANPVIPAQAGIHTNSVIPAQRGIQTNPAIPAQRGIQTNPVIPAQRGIEANPVIPAQAGIHTGKVSTNFFQYLFKKIITKTAQMGKERCAMKSTKKIRKILVTISKIIFGNVAKKISGINKKAQSAKGRAVVMKQFNNFLKTISERLTSLVETGINSVITKTAAGCRKVRCVMHTKKLSSVKVFLEICIITIFSSLPALAWQEWNDHYYELFSYNNGSGYQWTWDTARSQAQSYLGGDLAVITSSNENTFLVNTWGEALSQSWIGGYQPTGSVEPEDGWIWVTGETWDYTYWANDSPNEEVPNENYLAIRNEIGRWGDFTSDTLIGAVVERQPERCPTAWQYIWNNDTTLSENWDFPNTDTLYNVHQNQTSATVDSKTWRYLAKQPWWGAGKNAGDAWVDGYGFKHVYLVDNTSGISTFDRSIKWEYIANADANGVFGNVDWSLSEVDTMNGLYTPGSSAVIDSITWRYLSNQNWWSTGKTEGEAWIDSYGFYHIYLLNGTRGISTFDRNTQWQYIVNADVNNSFGTVDWSLSEIDTMTGLDTAGESTDIDGTTWRYLAKKPWWGAGKIEGAAWTDTYGFKHIYLVNNVRDISTFDRSSQWEYIASADVLGIFGNVDWNLSEVDTMTAVDSAGESAIIDGVTWKYLAKQPWWGSGKIEGDAWIDSYGFKHIYQVADTRAISTFNRIKQWEYIANSDALGTVGNVDWNLSEVDTMTAIDSAGESAIIDGITWRYLAKQPWWGSGKSEGDSWTDSYGFKHIYQIDNVRAVSTFDRPPQWEYIANAAALSHVGTVDWSLSEVDTLTAIDTLGESANIDGVSWRYLAKQPWWGAGKNQGDSWTDTYGFGHIYMVNNVRSISNFNRSVQWEYIANADALNSFGNVDWNLSEVDAMTGLSQGESTSIDSVTWRYLAKQPWWGSGKSEGNAWTDTYGFNHIYLLNNVKAVSTFDRSIQWEYLANIDILETFGTVDWNLSELDTMVAIDSSGESANIDGTTWHYSNRNYNTNGWWGASSSHGEGEAWTDNYGFKHVNLVATTRGITDFNRSIQWEYIANANIIGAFSNSVDWDILADVDNLENLLATQASIQVDGLNWYYKEANYSANGAWGHGQTVGTPWIDKYGFWHIYLDTSKGITTSDKPLEWDYIGKAGYSSEFSEAFGENWSYGDVDALYNLYMSQSMTDFIIINGMKWTYTTEDFSLIGKNKGDYWIGAGGWKYIYIGSGLQSSPIPFVPEIPAGAIGIILGVLQMYRITCKKK